MHTGNYKFYKKMKPMVNVIKSAPGAVGRSVKQGVKKFLTPLRNVNIARKKQDDIWRKEGEDMMAGRERYK